MATRVESDDNGDGDGGKSNGDGNKSGGQATTRAMAATMTVAGNNEGIVMAMRVPSNKKGEGGKAMGMVTRVGGEQQRRQ